MIKCIIDLRKSHIPCDRIIFHMTEDNYFKLNDALYKEGVTSSTQIYQKLREFGAVDAVEEYIDYLNDEITMSRFV